MSEETDRRMRDEGKTIIARFLSNSVEPSLTSIRRAEQIITALERLGLKIARRPGNCEAPNGGGRTTADCPGEECRRTGQCQVA